MGEFIKPKEVRKILGVTPKGLKSLASALPVEPNGYFLRSKVEAYIGHSIDGGNGKGTDKDVDPDVVVELQKDLRVANVKIKYLKDQTAKAREQREDIVETADGCPDRLIETMAKLKSAQEIGTSLQAQLAECGNDYTEVAKDYNKVARVLKHWATQSPTARRVINELNVTGYDETWRSEKTGQGIILRDMPSGAYHEE